MKKKKKNIPFQEDWLLLMKPLSDESFGKIWRTVTTCAVEGKEPDLSGFHPSEQMAVSFIFPQVISSMQNYQEVCKKREDAAKAKWNRQNIQAGTNVPKSMQLHPNVSKCKQVDDKDKDKDKDKFTNVNTPYTPQGEEAVEDVSKIDYKGIVDFYNKCVEGKNMPRCVKLTGKRKKAINARLKQFKLEDIYAAIQKAADSDFCNGQNDHSWRADFDFIFCENNMAKILEGKYRNHGTVKVQEQDPMDKKTSAFLEYSKEHYKKICPALEKQGRYFFEQAYNIADKNSNYLNEIVSQMNDQGITENILDRFTEIYDKGRNEGKFPSAYDLMRQKNGQT